MEELYAHALGKMASMIALQELSFPTLGENLYHHVAEAGEETPWPQIVQSLSIQ
jgi:hypothetical protein